MKSKFIGYSIGLECNGHGRVGKLIKVEISALANDQIRLQAVSGHNLAKTDGFRLITREKYEALPCDVYDKAVFAIAALHLCGWTPMALDAEG